MRHSATLRLQTPKRYTCLFGCGALSALSRSFPPTLQHGSVTIMQHVEDVWRSFLVCLVMRIRLIEVCVYMLCDLVSDSSPECSQSLASCIVCKVFGVASFCCSRYPTVLYFSETLNPKLETLN